MCWGRDYLPSKRASLTFLQCVTAVELFGVALGLGARHVPPALLWAYVATWAAVLVVAFLVFARWLWHTFPWWASLLPMLSVASVEIGFGQFSLLLVLHLPTPTEQAFLHATEWVGPVGIFAALVGGFGMLVAVGLNQVRR
jgi:hypothetical protein